MSVLSNAHFPEAINTFLPMSTGVVVDLNPEETHTRLGWTLIFYHLDIQDLLGLRCVSGSMKECVENWGGWVLFTARGKLGGGGHNWKAAIIQCAPISTITHGVQGGEIGNVLR